MHKADVTDEANDCVEHVLTPVEPTRVRISTPPSLGAKLSSVMSVIVGGDRQPRWVPYGVI